MTRTLRTRLDVVRMFSERVAYRQLRLAEAPNPETLAYRARRLAEAESDYAAAIAAAVAAGASGAQLIDHGVDLALARENALTGVGQ